MNDKISPVKARILEFIESVQITKKEFCEKTSISYPNMCSKSLQSELGGSQISEILSQYPMLNADWLLLGKGPMLNSNSQIETAEPPKSTLEKVPVLVAPETPAPVGLPLIPYDAMAGLPSIDNPGISLLDCEHYVVPEFQSRGADYLIRVSGSSMYPKYSNGDLLACRRISDILFFQWGKVYVLDTSQGILVKRVQPSDHDDIIRLVSDNAERYQPFDLPTSDIRSLAIVVGVIRFE